MQSYVVNSCTSLRLSKFKAKSTSSPMSTSATATATSTSNTNSSCSSNSSNTNSQNHNRNLASVILNSLLNDYSGGSMTLKFCNNNNNNNNSDQAIYWVILILNFNSSTISKRYNAFFKLDIQKRL